jgi:hypothetical protein
LSAGRTSVPAFLIQEDIFIPTANYNASFEIQ